MHKQPTIWRIKIHTGPETDVLASVADRVRFVSETEPEIVTDRIYVSVSDLGDKWGGLNAESRVMLALGWSDRNAVRAIRPLD